MSIDESAPGGNKFFTIGQITTCIAEGLPADRQGCGAV